MRMIILICFFAVLNVGSFLLGIAYRKKVAEAKLGAAENEAKSISFAFSTEALLERFESINEFLKLTAGNPNYTLLVAHLCAKLKH